MGQYRRNINKSACIEAESPADKIREIQSEGEYVNTNDLPNGAVEVKRFPRGSSNIEIWTFFPSLSSCEASLPRNQHIGNRYE